MFYNSNFFNPEDGLREVLEAVQKVNLPRYLYAINDSEISELEIDTLGNHVAKQKLNLDNEYKQLNEISKTFNKEFVSEWNRRFDTSLGMLRTIKNGLKETRNLFQTFAPTVHPTRRAYTTCSISVPNIHSVSMLRSNEYVLDMYGAESYPPCVSGLYNEMSKFFELMQASIELCLKTIKDERTIRANTPQVVHLYDSFSRKVKSEVEEIIRYVGKMDKLKEDTEDIYASYLMSGKDINKFAPMAFHRWHPKKVKRFLARIGLEKAEELNISKLERNIWGTNISVISMVRYIIANFDHLLPDEHKSKKLPGETVVAFMLWSRVDKKHWKAFAEIFNEKYNEKGGQYETLTYNGIISAKNKLDKQQSEDLVNEFDKSVQKLSKNTFQERKLLAIG